MNIPNLCHSATNRFPSLGLTLPVTPAPVDAELGLVGGAPDHDMTLEIVTAYSLPIAALHASAFSITGTVCTQRCGMDVVPCVPVYVAKYSISAEKLTCAATPAQRRTASRLQVRPRRVVVNGDSKRTIADKPS